MSFINHLGSSVGSKQFPSWPSRSKSKNSYEALDFKKFVEELKVLDLFRIPFTPQLYAERLMLPLHLEIRMRYIEQIRNPEILRKLSDEGITGGLIIKPGPSPIAWVIVPESSSPLEEMLSGFHELGHLAGRHAISPRRLVGYEFTELGSDPVLWRPPGYLTEKEPPSVDDDLHEDEAEQRAEYCLLAGLHGEQIFARYSWTLGHDPRADIDELSA